MKTEQDLARVAVALGATGIGGPLSDAERALIASIKDAPAPSPHDVAETASAILSGADPLGDAFCKLRVANLRRSDGAFYTPAALVDPMVEWAIAERPARVVDAGCGSGRFAAAIARILPDLPIVAVDLDPLATLMTRAHLRVLGASDVRVLQSDYTSLALPQIDGHTAFIGNPPYVRHHQLTPAAKAWARTAAATLGHGVSGLAGLHAYFFLATATSGRSGDVGCFVTSSEWLDVNYGAIIRNLLLSQLGGDSVHVVEPTAAPFADVQATAAITTFHLGTKPASMRLRKVADSASLTDLGTTGQAVLRDRLVETSRWSVFLRPTQIAPEGFVELGELCRVHRGTVTGANSTWVIKHSANLPESVLYASITKARELFAAGDRLTDASHLRRVADIPTDLDELNDRDARLVAAFIKAAKQAGVDRGYIASHRKKWWAVGLKSPAPILATYMARRPPAFVLNDVDARHINIAHGIYPRESLDKPTLNRLAESLRAAATRSHGRVYAGGLMKWEPKEMERLLVPDIARLNGHDDLSAGLDA